jgi:predicted permease
VASGIAQRISVTDVPPPQPGERACAWLTAAYPRAFRDRFEAGMRNALAEDYAIVRREGLRARVKFWIVSAFDALRFGLAERFSTAGPPPQRDPSRPKGAAMSAFRVDLRDAWRSLRATPVVTVACVLSLALGIGANTALFSIVNSLLLKSLPVRDPARLVLIDDGPWTNPIWEQIRDRQSQVFDGAFAWSSHRFDLSTHGESDIVAGAYASGNMFDVLGVAPILGRTLNVNDDVRGLGPDGPVAVISEQFWRHRFGSANDIVGKTLTISRKPFTIVGVLPAHFLGPEVGSSGDVIVPIAAEAVLDGRSMLDQRSAWWLDIMARLKPGQTKEAAAAALHGIQPQIRTATIPQNWEKKDQDQFLAQPLALLSAATGESSLREKFQRPLTILLVVVGLVLVIACANIANLLIARASARRHELSLRLALGATRWRIAMQLLFESLFMALAGATAGLFIAQWASQLLVRQLATSTSLVTLDLAIDWRVLIFTTGVAVVTALLFGLAPAVGVGRIAPSEALKERGRGVTGDARFGVRNALVVAQIGLSLALVVGAGLFVHTFATLTNRPSGFNADGLLLAHVDIRRSAVAPDNRLELFDRLREAAAAVPGVSMASASVVTPVGNIRWNTEVEVPDGPKLVGRESLSWVNGVTPGWFATYGTKLESGRDFDERDRKGTPIVAIVNDAFAHKFFPGVASPIGRTFNERLPGTVTTYEIVGVVEDAAYTSLRSEPSPIIYEPLAQTDDANSSALSYGLRLRPGSTAGVTRALASAFDNIDGGISVRFELLADQLRSSLRQERLLAMLAGFFGVLALILSALGLYGVTSYAVGRRRAEIGIRLALGATRAGIVQLVLGRVSWLVGFGILGGTALSLWLAKYVSTLLYGVQSRDPWTLAGAAIVLGAVGLLAGWLPAQRASRVDPTAALRTE